MQLDGALGAMQSPAAETRRELISLWNMVFVTDITSMLLEIIIKKTTDHSHINLDGAKSLFLGEEMCPMLLNPPYLLSCTISALGNVRI